MTREAGATETDTTSDTSDCSAGVGRSPLDVLDEHLAADGWARTDDLGVAHISEVVRALEGFLDPDADQ